MNIGQQNKHVDTWGFKTVYIDVKKLLYIHPNNKFSSV